jgi:hypothetical protein
VSRQTIPFAAADISALAKSLRGQLLTRPGLPSHVEMLNMLARATGHRNFQHLRAGAVGAEAEPVAPAEPALNPATLRRIAANFDDQGRMTRWPTKASHQDLSLWVIWARMPSRRTFTEREVNEVFAPLHLFGDPAILRRRLYETGLLWRTRDGREYRRIEHAPPADARALLERVLP